MPPQEAARRGDIRTLWCVSLIAEVGRLGYRTRHSARKRSHDAADDSAGYRAQISGAMQIIIIVLTLDREASRDVSLSVNVSFYYSAHCKSHRDVYRSWWPIRR